LRSEWFEIVNAVAHSYDGFPMFSSLGFKMFRRVIAAMLLSMQAIVPAAAYDTADGQFYYRYKTGITEDTHTPDPDSSSKDITAFYIAGVGEDFSELLPMKPQWETDDWRIVGGTLPNGITFDSSTLTFEGKATAVTSKRVVELKGYDSNNNEVATASATFSVYDLPSNVVKVDFYHHVGQFGSDALVLPQGVTVDGDPTLISAAPSGVTYNARYFEGTPTKAAVYPVLAFGYDYRHRTDPNAKPIVAFKGNYTVEDGPTFKTIRDDVRPLVGDIYYGCSSTYECAVWDKQGFPQIKRPLTTFNKVRYYIEMQNGTTKLPGTLTYGSDSMSREWNGRTYTAFDQATIRYKAIDIDGVPGYSNWFKIGSRGHVELCKPYDGDSAINLFGEVGALFGNAASGYTIPTGVDQNKKAFALTAGTLPAGLKFDTTLGAFTGTPTAFGKATGIKVTISFPANSTATPIVCGPYDFDITPEAVKVSYVGLKQDYRVGEALSVELKASGVISPYKFTMNADANLPTGVVFDGVNKLSGTVDGDGDYSANFVLTNGDGLTYRTSVSFTGHKAVDINEVPALSEIKRYDSADLFTVTYDPKTIIGTETFTLNGGQLPDGFTFNKGSLLVSGGTCLPVNKYGPFSISLSDDTGQSDKTNDFFIDVTERGDIVANETVDPLTFRVNKADTGQKAFSVTQTQLAAQCMPDLVYTLTPAALPDGLEFSPTTGYISGQPKTKSTTSGYTIKIDEVSPYNYSKVSQPFTLDVADPLPIETRTLTAIQTNVGVGPVSSDNPKATLTAIRDQLVGYEQSVVFDGRDPDVPGLNFNTITGVLSGTPTAEYSGNVTISYHDGGNRPGTLIVPVVVYPFPTLVSDQISYEVPRLSDADDYNIVVKPGNTGFYKGVTYSLAPTSAALPHGLILEEGTIKGNSDAAKDTVYNLVIRGTSKANSNVYVDYPITLKIVVEQPMKLSLLPKTKLVWKIDQNTGLVVPPSDKLSSTKPTGSFVKPLAYSLINGPSWMTIDANGQLGGKPPALGETTVTVQVMDAESHTAQDTATVKITLSGYVQMSPGGSDGAIKVRQGEAFETKAETVTNYVDHFDYKVTGEQLSTVTLDKTTGAFKGWLDTIGAKIWYLDAMDADNRATENPYKFTVTSAPPVKLGDATSFKSGKQYDPNQPIFIQFQKAQNILGNANYAVTGVPSIPGKLYYKSYDTTGATPVAVYISTNGQVTRQQIVTKTVLNPDGTTTASQVLQTEAETEATLTPDHMIFDTEKLTLTGIPSSYGQFDISMSVSDDHATTGYKVDPTDPTKDEYNQATTNVVSLDIDQADDLMVSNSASSETLSQYTSQPTLKSSVTNDAYGLGVSWAKIDNTGDLPSKINSLPSAQSMGYTGYPDTQGSWSNIRWQAIDAAGRQANTDAVSFTVGPRLSFSLKASPSNPRGMIVFKQDADLWVRATNAADGKAIGKANWTVSGAANLPPNVTYTITDDGVHFTGKSDTIAAYKDIIVSATDSRSANADVNLTFNVTQSGDPIGLDVFDITTKAGYPLIMEPPFAADTLATTNSYGAIRYYSNDLPTIPGISLNGTTGYIDGTVSQAQDLTFDLFVADETDRVTSKPVTAHILPKLRVLVPSQFTAEQGVTVSQTVATDYKLGTVSYEKGAGTWPLGFVVNKDTGVISSSYLDPMSGKTVNTVVAEQGTYAGLTIIAKDVFGNQVNSFTDQQSSNAFTIKVNPSTGTPDIANQAKTILGTEGQAVNWAPKKATGSTWVAPVIVKGEPTISWNYAGTLYTANYDLTQYGLTFDKTTGAISGTPTKPFIIRDFDITVTSSIGETDVTAPFWIGVAPKDALALDPAQKLVYKFRNKTISTTDPVKLVVTTYIGNLTYSKVTTTVHALNATTGAFTMDFLNNVTTDDVAFDRVVRVADEFNRKLDFTYNFTAVKALAITVSPSDGVAAVDSDYTVATPVDKLTLVGLIGNPTWTVTGLPEGLRFDTTSQMVIGKIAAGKYANNTKFTPTFKVVDSNDAAEATNTTALITIVDGHLFWRIYDTGSTGNWWWNTSKTNLGTGYSGADTATRFQGWGSIYSTWYEGATNVSDNRVQNSGLPNKGRNYTDILWDLSGYADDFQMKRDASGAWWKVWKFDRPVSITKISWTWSDANNAQYSAILKPNIQYSDDGINWTTKWSATLSRSSARPQGTTCPTSICP
jgi:hypothetical protein